MERRLVRAERNGTHLICCQHQGQHFIGLILGEHRVLITLLLGQVRLLVARKATTRTRTFASATASVPSSASSCADSSTMAAVHKARSYRLSLCSGNETMSTQASNQRWSSATGTRRNPSPGCTACCTPPMATNTEVQHLTLQASTSPLC